MIRVECTKKDDKIIDLVILGHANSAEYGKDLVCAAVSAVSLGGLNNLENPKAFLIESNEKQGLVHVKAISDVSMHDYIVLETILTQLKSIEAMSSKHIKVIEKGC